MKKFRIVISWWIEKLFAMETPLIKKSLMSEKYLSKGGTQFKLLKKLEQSLWFLNGDC